MWSVLIWIKDIRFGFLSGLTSTSTLSPSQVVGAAMFYFTLSNHHRAESLTAELQGQSCAASQRPILKRQSRADSWWLSENPNN